MKMNKWFMLGMVGLAFTACSNEEELGNQLPNGTGAVTINIVSPAMTKSVDAGTTDQSVEVKGDVDITLTASNGSKTITLTEEQLKSQSFVTFWNVEKPTKVTVSMNGGQQSYTDIAPNDVAFNGIAPAAIPVYGEVGADGFTLTDETASPGGKGGSNYEESVTDEAANSSTVYQLYTATVQLAIPVARLEVSGIQHITDDHATGDCKYNKLTIAGVYLDNVYATGAGVTYANGSFPCVSGINPTDYSYDGTHGTGIEAILKDAATVTNFLTEAVWPDAGNAYSYYFFGADGADNLPKFKIYFSESEAKDADHPLPAPRYAMITSYKQTQDKGGAPITQFLPGHIYKIVSAKLSDENIIGDEGGNTLYGVEVTVEEATWTVETIDATWQD